MPDSPSGGVPSNAASQSPFGSSGATSGGVPDGGVPAADAGTAYGGNKQECPFKPPEAPAVKPVKIRTSLFYDGTGNNRFNVGQGPEHSKDDDDSFTAGLSNVAKLESAGLDRPGPGMDHHITVYTEGIGTTDGQADSRVVGQGLGKGDTGIDAKVDQGIASAVSDIADFAQGRPIAVLQVDVFGFSRGAAAARFSIWKCMQQAGSTLKDRLVAMGLEVGGLEMRFAGLYDTVACYGAYHKNDTAQLHLNAIQLAAKVVQLAAAEEHRENFRLTNIASAGGKGRQIFLPGAHSDVGGGYADLVDEVDHQVLDLDVAWVGDAERRAIERERKWLVGAGWYRESELAATNFWNEVRATRRGIVNTYSRIPLHLMARFAREEGVILKATLEDKHPVPPALGDAQAAINAYVGKGGNSSASDWFSYNTQGDPAWHIALRHDYLHFSASYGGLANPPQWSDGGPVSGRRKRIIQDG